MTDALWNGIIGAGGVAICCAVYLSFKAAKKVFSKLKFSSSKPKNMNTSDQQGQYNALNSQLSSAESKRITITIPAKRQIFTRQNIRAFGFFILAIICFYAIEDVSPSYQISSGYSLSFEGDYYTNVSGSLHNIALNTEALSYLIEEISDYFFGIFGGLFALLGCTTISFKHC